MLKLIPILMVALVCLRQIDGACNTCTAHGHACTGLDTFKICNDGKVDDSMTMKCNVGEICTDLSLVCVPIANSTAIPGCRSRCGVCEDGKSFACTSSSTYALCSDMGITNITGTCPRYKVCDTAGASLCILPCDITSLVCDKDPDTVTTPTPPTPSTPTPPTPTPSTPTPSTPTPSTPTPSTPTPSTPTPSTPTPSTPTPSTPTPSTPTPSTPTPSTPTPPTSTPSTPTPRPTPGPTKPPQTVCNDKKAPGRYSLTDNNTNLCDEFYVYCRMQGSNLVAIPSKCPSGRSFSPTTQSCQITPAGCFA